MPKLPKTCNEKRSILESSLAYESKAGNLDRIEIVELPVDRSDNPRASAQFHALVSMKGPPARRVYLTTRRDRDTPRVFKHLERLLSMLNENCPTCPIEIHRNGQPKTTVSPLKKGR